MDGAPASPDMRIDGARQRRAGEGKRRETVDRIDRNRTDAIEWAKQRRAKAAVAEAKREERKRAQAAAIKAQEEYEEQLEQYKQRGYAPSHAFSVNAEGGTAAEEPASWDDTPIGGVMPSRQQSRAPRSGPATNSQQQQQRQRQQQQPDGPFGRSWNDGFAETSGWSMMSDNLLDEEPPPAAVKKSTARSRGRGRGRGRGQARGEGQGGSDSRAPRSSLKSVKEERERRKQEEQDRHEEALRQARIQAAAERRLAAERARMHEGGGARLPRSDARSPVDGTRAAPAHRHSPTLSAKQRGATVVPRTRSRSPHAPAAVEAVCRNLCLAAAWCTHMVGSHPCLC